MIREIQYLRGIAASMVVLFHTIPQLKRMGYTGPEFEILSYGVDIFFVISGFIMTYISIDTPTSRYKFISNRIIRIVPIYWLLTTFVAILGVIFPFLLQSTQVDLVQYIKSMLFIPYIHPIAHGFFPLLQPGWTLNYEMYFYFIFALFISIQSDSKYLFMIASLVFATIIFGQQESSTILCFYGNPIVFEFGMGILLAYIYVRHNSIFQSKNTFNKGLLTTASGFALLFLSHGVLPDVNRVFVAGVPSFLVVMGALFLANAPKRFHSVILEKVGDSSYSLYLSHPIFLSAFGQLFRKVIYPFTGVATYIVFPVIALLFALIFGYFFYLIIESYLTRRIKNRFG
jgi:exopolysaccharide production protein ExoZ